MPFAEAAALAQTMPGVAGRAAQAILAETGVDMTPFPTAAHLASWARLCPGNHESAGKRQPTTTGKGATWLRATLQQVAWAAIRTKQSYYRALYHRLKARGGAKKAIVAVQHAMIVALWHMLSTASSTTTSALTTSNGATPRGSAVTTFVVSNSSATMSFSSTKQRNARIVS